MPIPEDQLACWSHQGAAETAKRTHESIRAALKAYDWPDDVKYEVYLQGSYKNGTNIRGDSDVDVVVQLNAGYGYDPSDDPTGIPPIKAYVVAYWQDFRCNVLDTLANRYGRSNVSEGKKAIKVTTPHLKADVVVCIRELERADPPLSACSPIERMTFYVPSEQRWVTNYPKPHYDNGCAKNKRTDRSYKPTVRMLKNARTYLVVRGDIPADLAPSYFLECLLYNVPNDKFDSYFQSTFCNVVNWLSKADFSRFVCQNEQVLLFGSSPEQWSEKNARRFIKAMENLWNNGS